MNDKDPEPDPLFRAAVADVRPLDRRRSPDPSRSSVRSGDSARYKARRQAAAGSMVEDRPNTQVQKGFVPDVGPEEILSWSRDGVRRSVLRGLRRGTTPVEDKLDLHGLTVSEAHERVHRFIERATAEGRRCLLIIHGKGTGREAPARLKSCVYQWLQDHPRSLALHSARPAEGGAGATRLLIKNARGQRR